MYGAYSRQDDKERQSLGGGLLEGLVPPVQMYDEPSRPISISDAFKDPNTVQMFKDVRQRISGNSESKTNNTGIPDNMRQDFEEKSGLSFDDVQVHYNSDKPAQLQALAYTQGNHVYVGPGQEKHLRHELGHVVQQKQGRISATTKVNGMPVNDDEGMESEADNISKNVTTCPVHNTSMPIKNNSLYYDLANKEVIQRATYIKYGRINQRNQWFAPFLLNIHTTIFITPDNHTRVMHTNGEMVYADVFNDRGQVLSRAWNHQGPPLGICNHHAAYVMIARAIINNHLNGHTIGEAIASINQAITALNAVGIQHENIPYVRFDDSWVGMNKEFDDAIANIANDPRNLFFAPITRGDAGGTRLDWPSALPGGVTNAPDHHMHVYSTALALHNML